MCERCLNNCGVYLIRIFPGHIKAKHDCFPFVELKKMGMFYLKIPKFNGAEEFNKDYCIVQVCRNVTRPRGKTQLQGFLVEDRILHFNNYGKWTSNSKPASHQHYCVWLLLWCSYCGMQCYFTPDGSVPMSWLSWYLCTAFKGRRTHSSLWPNFPYLWICTQSLVSEEKQNKT